MQFSKNKRGLVVGSLGSIILIIVAFLILLTIGKVMTDNILNTTDDKICALSAIANSQSKKIAVGAAFAPIDCPPHYVDIVEKDLTKPLTKVESNFLDKPGVDYFGNKHAINGGKFTASELKTTDELSEEEKKAVLITYRFNKKIAEEMRSCWKKLGEGKLNLFSDWFDYLGTEDNLASVNNVNDFFDKYIPHKVPAPSACVICSRITIDKETLDALKLVQPKIDKNYENYYKNYNSLAYWLASHPYNWPQKNEMSYYEYLGDDYTSGIFTLQNRFIDFSKFDDLEEGEHATLALTFVNVNINALDKIVKNLGAKDWIGVLAGTAVGTTVGNSFKGAIVGGIATGTPKKIAEGFKDILSGKGNSQSLYLMKYNDVDAKDKDGRPMYCTKLYN